MIKFLRLRKGIASKALALSIISSLSSAVCATQVQEIKGPTEASEKPEKVEVITDRRHPEYVRCRTESIIGSLARKRKICMTNTKWEEARKRGQRFTNDMVGSIQGMSGGSSFSNGK